jgi:hypothetical protein
VWATVPLSDDEHRFKLEANAGQVRKSKEVVLKARAPEPITVRYSARTWVLAADLNGPVDYDKLRAADAKKHTKALNDLGFDTRIENKITYGLFSNTERDLVWARTPVEQVRTFNDKSSAQEFVDTLRSLIRDDRHLAVHGP